MEEIRDPGLREKVIEVWALAIAGSSFTAIGDIAPSGNPGVMTLKRGTQVDHLRGVARLAMGMADELAANFPELEIDRDIVIAGALCHDVGKPWEFDPENRKRWESSPRAAGLPSVRHPAYGAHLCFTVGLPGKWRTARPDTPERVSSSFAASRTRSSTTPTMHSGTSCMPGG